MASGAVQQLHRPDGVEGHLIGHFRHGGVSLVGWNCGWILEVAQFDSFRTVRITGFVWCVAVDAMYWRVGAGRTFLASWECAWMIFGLVATGTDGTVGVVSTERSGMTITLAVMALSASTV
jgi:hypothetical protein